MPITLANLMLNEKEGLSENDEESELGSLSILLFLLLLFTYFTLAWYAEHKNVYISDKKLVKISA